MAHSEALRFGIIGCGRATRDLHLPGWMRLAKEARCDAVCDASQPAAALIAQKLNVARQYTDPGELLRKEEGLDFVVIATPGRTHVPLTLQALEQGHNVLCEKPLAFAAKDVERIEHAMARDRRVCAIHNYRFKPNTEAALKVFGGSGEPARHIDLRWRGMSLAREHAEWLRRERENKLVLFDFAYHFVDLVCVLLGPTASIDYLEAKSNPEMVLHIRANTRHKWGGTASIDLRMDSPAAFTEMELIGKTKSAELDFVPDGFRLRPATDTPAHRGLADARRVIGFGSDLARAKAGLGMPQNSRGHHRLFTAYLAALRADGELPVPLSSVAPTIDLLERLGKAAYGE